MARIRTVKPGLFRHEELYELEVETGLPVRLAFIGLFTCCDKQGRFNWRPRALKLDVMPYDHVDFSRVLDALATRGFVVRYASNGEDFGYIPTFTRHQVINNRETDSNLPDPCDCTIIDACATREPRVSEISKGKGREGNVEEEGKGKDICAAPSQALALVDDPVLITLPTNRPNQAYRVLQSHFDQFAALYPAVDVPQELRGMAGWLIGNPKNAKTASGMPRFINAWLSKAQNRSKPNGHGKPSKNDNWLAGAAELADELRND